MRRRAFVAAMCGSIPVVLAGCGRGGTDSPASAGTVPSGRVTGTVRVWAQGTEAELLPELARGFEEENPGARVEVTAVPWESAHDKYQTAIAGGTVPDIGMMGTTWMPDFAGAFQPVPEGLDTGDIFADVKGPTVVDGATVGVPWYVDVRVIYYRTDLAAEAGYPRPPETWEDFRELTRAMQTRAGADWGIALLPRGTDSFQGALPWIWSAGASLMNGDGTAWTLDTPRMVEALEYYQSFFTDGIADPNMSTEAGTAESAFVDGRTPVLIAGGYEMSLLREAGGDDFDSSYGVMTFPRNESGTSFVGGSDLVVFRDSENSDAAWKLVEYLIRPDVQAEWYELTGDLPASQSAWDDSRLSGDPKLEVFRDQLNDVMSPPANTAWTQVGAAGDTQLERIVRGADPAEALGELQSAAESIGTGN
ncbi:sugar ABC transporter substrate-binding protein [Streptomyces sp. NPDC127098]|uniref:sugar ABC transporter substrate-binding protein n=1 Tax=Streptomyces sp. NPDC127098 TaxID=3347137 RepID=UPI003647A73D